MSNPDPNEMRHIGAMSAGLWPSNGAFAAACGKVEQMSDQKTLGQVAFEALKSANGDNPGPGMTWKTAPDWVREKWEKIGQAVAREVLAATMVDAVKSIGAAEERGRLAAMFESPKHGHKLEQLSIRDLGLIASWLRTGGNP